MVHILVREKHSAFSYQPSAFSFHTQQSAIANECLEADG